MQAALARYRRRVFAVMGIFATVGLVGLVVLVLSPDGPAPSLEGSSLHQFGSMLPWVSGGGVAIGLLSLVLHRRMVGVVERGPSRTATFRGWRDGWGNRRVRVCLASDDPELDGCWLVVTAIPVRTHALVHEAATGDLVRSTPCATEFLGVGHTCRSPRVCWERDREANRR